DGCVLHLWERRSQHRRVGPDYYRLRSIETGKLRETISFDGERSCRLCHSHASRISLFHSTASAPVKGRVTTHPLVMPGTDCTNGCLPPGGVVGSTIQVAAQASTMRSPGSTIWASAPRSWVRGRSVTPPAGAGCSARRHPQTVTLHQ